MSLQTVSLCHRTLELQCKRFDQTTVARL